MSAPVRVMLDPVPDALVLGGDTAVIKGATALGLYRVVVRGDEEVFRTRGQPRWRRSPR